MSTELLTEKEKTLEVCRSIGFGLTLQEAYNCRVCISCKVDLSQKLQDYSSEEMDVWLLEGYCAVCQTQL